MSNFILQKVHYLKRRRDELDKRLKEYKESKIDLINLAAAKKKPYVINKYVEEVRSGGKDVPEFIKRLPVELAGDIDYLKNYLISINNEVKVKTKVLNEFKKSQHDPERVKKLLGRVIKVHDAIVRLSLPSPSQKLEKKGSSKKKRP